MRRLKAAGAEEPKKLEGPSFNARMSALAASVTGIDAMINVPNVRATVDWYQSIGFELTGYDIDGDAAWARVSFGGASLMFVPRGTAGAIPEARFIQDIYEAFYGQREFAIVDLNGYELHFAQPLTPSRSAPS